MPGKKKGGKGKKKGDGGDKKLPPPPNLDSTKDGAQEALLKFRIRGKEEIIGQYSEEAEVFKDRNYQQKERNHVILREQTVHYQSLVKQARDYERELQRADAVEDEKVEQALMEKFQLARQVELDLEELERRITATERELAHSKKELHMWETFRDTGQHANATHIASMRSQMEQMEKEEEELKATLETKLARVRVGVEGRCAEEAEGQRRMVTEQLLDMLDEESRGEMTDNAWLKKEISLLRDKVDCLRQETDAMETRNLALMEGVYQEQLEELQATRELYRYTTRSSHTDDGGRGTSSDCSLPSLVDIGKCTAEEGPGGQLGQLELNLLAVHGSPAPLSLPPDTLHLPPLQQQRRAHSALPPRLGWPVTGAMLRSVG